LPQLRDPERFRSWLVAIAIREVRGRARVRHRTLPHADLDVAVADQIDTVPASRTSGNPYIQQA
jgi:DNA-directed RNA polymerase specialized sigma24 family protein